MPQPHDEISEHWRILQDRKDSSIRFLFYLFVELILNKFQKLYFDVSLGSTDGSKLLIKIQSRHPPKRKIENRAIEH